VTGTGINRKWNITLLLVVIITAAGFLSAGTPSEIETEKRTAVAAEIKRASRYHPDSTDFVIEIGRNRFNRILYGTNTHSASTPGIGLNL